MLISGRATPAVYYSRPRLRRGRRTRGRHRHRLALPSLSQEEASRYHVSFVPFDLLGAGGTPRIRLNRMGFDPKQREAGKGEGTGEVLFLMGCHLPAGGSESKMTRWPL